jgi:hypothetical protein
MPEEQPKPHVKKHLDKQSVQWKDLKHETRKALNAFSEEELKKVDDLGTAFEEEELDIKLRVSAVH